MMKKTLNFYLPRQVARSICIHIQFWYLF